MIYLQVENTSFLYHVKRRFGDIGRDIVHILRIVAISVGVVKPSESKKKELRNKWHNAGQSFGGQSIISRLNTNSNGSLSTAQKTGCNSLTTLQSIK